ncbi:phage integrase family protein [Ralstonia insidiosa]|uniref:Tyrosine-type recombinase/integrase n=1 Tax=Ralstonia insidiosa TaxID=190721 RepID=A0A848P8G0_9RALS|nr:tyrosine-type recombinase/integrase [Ralstonia insidiosa]NMV39858.1 tyrosine-type recombinase/integrase [Ralstonia insidiosa]
MTRRLSRQHFAMYRGYLDGVDVKQLHLTYGETGTDQRLTGRLIATLRDTLAQAARRARDIEAAHLLRLKPGSIPLEEAHAAAATSEIPTLEAFREATDPDGFYSEAELLELYREAYPPEASPRVDRRLARNARLRERQAAALARMEKALAEDPKPDHPVDGWLDPAVAKRLADVGVLTLGDLLELIQRRRQRWYTAVPKVGPKAAQRIVDWLVLHAWAFGFSLSPLATTRRRELRAGHPVLTRPAVVAEVVPIEALIVPADLDGSTGLNRAPTPAHQAEMDNDKMAIEAWIRIRGVRSADTARAYRREAERLLLWAIIVKRKPLSSLNTLDCAEYINQFLRNPQPTERWIGRGRVERFDPAWRPFAGKLSDSSREMSRKLLSAMCSWLVDERYLLVNPFRGVPTVDVSAPAIIDVTGRTLTHAQWQYVLQTVTRVTYTPSELRDYFALLLAYATGLRRAELAAATTGALSRKALDAVLDDAWTLQVEGKGKRQRRVPIPRRLIAILADMLQNRPSAITLETAPGDTPLIGHLKTGKTLTADALARLYKRIFDRAADRLQEHAPRAAEDLRRASTHWLRHTHANHALDAGGDLRDVQSGLGHASLATTTIYTKGDVARQFRAVEAFFEASLNEGDTIVR